VALGGAALGRGRGWTSASGPAGQASCQYSEGADDGAGGRTGRRGSRPILGHQVLQGDVPAPQGPERFDPLDEPLAGGDALAAAGGAEPVAGGDVAALDGFGRLPAGPM
jgi:hypothetical protein